MHFDPEDVGVHLQEYPASAKNATISQLSLLSLTVCYKLFFDQCSRFSWGIMDLIIKVGIILNRGKFNTKIIDLGQMKLNIKEGKTLNQGTLNKASTVYSVEWLHNSNKQENIWKEAAMD